MSGGGRLRVLGLSIALVSLLALGWPAIESSAQQQLIAQGFRWALGK